jgi:hypothetical protein
VRTAVPSLVRGFGGELSVELLQLAITFWLGLSDQLLLVCPWGKVHYPLFGFLA